MSVCATDRSTFRFVHLFARYYWLNGQIEIWLMSVKWHSLWLLLFLFCVCCCCVCTYCFLAAHLLLLFLFLLMSNNCYCCCCICCCRYSTLPLSISCIFGSPHTHLNYFSCYFWVYKCLSEIELPALASYWNFSTCKYFFCASNLAYFLVKKFYGVFSRKKSNNNKRKKLTKKLYLCVLTS